MTAPLLLVAASGLAREVVSAVRAGDDRDIVGFVDDNAEHWGRVHEGVKVLGGLEVVADHPDTQVIVCAGKGIVRAGLVERLALPAERFATVIHPSASVSGTSRIGQGSIVLAGTVLTDSVQVGAHVTIMPGAILTHDDVVADYATLCAAVVLGGGVRIDERAYVGMSTSVRERVRIGADAVIGMGSVVLTDVPPAQTWYGAPAGRRGSGL